MVKGKTAMISKERMMKALHRGPRDRMRWFNMQMHEEFLCPYRKSVADAIRKPCAFHSDGNIFFLIFDRQQPYGLLQHG